MELSYNFECLLFSAVIVITIAVVVDELCTRTVISTPIMTPTTGLVMISFFWNTSPAAFPKWSRDCEGMNILHSNFIYFAFVVIYISIE